MESTEILQAELDAAILNWRETWKRGNLDEVMQLYTENVRVMRSGVGLIQGREKLRSTMESLDNMGFVDIDFHSDEIGGLGSGDIKAEGALAYQRYHEGLVRKDGTEISMIYGFMLWKRVSEKWLIEMYANCAVTPDASNTAKLRESIQKTLDNFGRSLSTKDTAKVVEYFSSDGQLTTGSPPKPYKGHEEIIEWVSKIYSERGCQMSLLTSTVTPLVEVYIFSQLVYVSCSNISVLDEDGQILLRGAGSMLMKRVGEAWLIQEAHWNICA